MGIPGESSRLWNGPRVGRISSIDAVLLACNSEILFVFEKAPEGFVWLERKPYMSPRARLELLDAGAEEDAMRSLLIGLGLLVTPSVWAELPAPAQLKKCEASVDQAMDAYNSKSWKDFFKDFSKASAALGSEQTFTNVYLDGSQKEFGTYESRSLDEPRSVFKKSVGLLIYKAKFSKKWATLSVNFLQEGGDWKIQQLRIDP